MIQKSIFHFNKNHSNVVRKKSIRFKHVFLRNMYRKRLDLLYLKMKILAGKHVEVDLGFLAT